MSKTEINELEQKLEKTTERRDGLLNWLKTHRYDHSDWDTNKRDYDLASFNVEQLTKKIECANSCRNYPVSQFSIPTNKHLLLTR